MKWIAILLFLLALPAYGQNQNGQNNGQGNKTGQGQGNNADHRGKGPEFVPGKPVTLLPGQDPKSLVGQTASNSRNLALPVRIALSDLDIVRSILLERIGYGGREIGFWASSHGDFTKEAGSTRVKTAGLIVALDHRFLAHLVLGLAGGYSHTWSNTLAANAGWGGIYAILFSGGWYLNQTAIAGGDSFETTRAGLLGTARANSSGWFASEITQAGYNLKRGDLTFGPYGLLQYAIAGNPTFSETGSSAPVTVHSGTSSSTVTDLGVDGAYEFGRLTIKTSVAWEHEYSDTTSFTTVSLVSIPSSAVTVAGTSLGHDSVVVNSGISYQLNRAINLSLGYTGQYGRRNYESNSATGSIRITF